MISAGEGLAGCGGPVEEPKSIQNNNINNDGVVPVAQDSAQEPGVPFAPTRYVGPEELNIPSASARGVIYQPFDGVPRSFTFPTSLACHGGSCTFALGPNVQSISQDFTETPQTPEVHAAFRGTIDHQNNFIADAMVVPDKTYVLFNGARQGIATETYVEDVVDTVYNFLGEVYGEPITCPAQMLPIGDQIWVSASMCVGSNSFRDGKVLVFEESETGSLEYTDPRAVTTTQKNPQFMTQWNTPTRNYVLVVNGGESTVGKTIAGDSGIDIFTADTGELVGNIPLGRAAARSITISGDGKLAILSSQHESNLYLVDLELLRVSLENGESALAPQSLTDVVIADASNPVRLGTSTNPFIVDVAYDDVSRNIFVSLFEGGSQHGRILQINAGYEVFADQGIRLNPDFGIVSANFFCSTGTTEYCGELELTDEGLVALTGKPASATFIPNERLGRDIESLD
ncbi:MAG: hypothetical protein Q7S68_00375 [Deltaproteobacteria bacterium]|nr:hypothetical protein [Deltaproteobacteria bacterium]